LSHKRGHFRSMFCSVSEKRGMHEFTYFSIGDLPTKSGSTASAASQYSLRDLHVNIMLNPHAATQVRMSSYERQAGSNPKVRVADYPPTTRTRTDGSSANLRHSGSPTRRWSSPKRGSERRLSIRASV